jgi:DNA-directed RNA polymerase subunit N (RpoN/RPB10)
VRCFSCGKVIGDKWEDYVKLLRDDVTEGCVSWSFCMFALTSDTV